MGFGNVIWSGICNESTHVVEVISKHCSVAVGSESLYTVCMYVCAQ